MIFNWSKHIRYCVRNKTMKYGFHATALEKNYQRLLIIKYMCEHEWSLKRIHNWLVKYDSEWDDMANDLVALVASASRVNWPKERDNTVYISKTELKKINSLPYVKEKRDWLLSLIVVAKVMYAKKGLAVVNSKERSYAWYLATGKDEFCVGRQKGQPMQSFLSELIQKGIIRTTTITRKYKSKDGYHTHNITNVVISADWLNFSKKTGYRMSDFERQTIRFCKNRVKDYYVICPQCGKKYIWNSQAKTSLCPTCYYKVRRANNRAAVKKLYHRYKDEAENSKT